MSKKIKVRTALLLAGAIILQNVMPVLGDVSSDTQFMAVSAGWQEAEAGTASAIKSENTSFVSFPSRFSDMLPEAFEEQYYVFTLDSVTDISISVESDDRDCQYGAELLDSGMSRLSISERKSGQRVTEKSLPAGTYFLRVFPLSENTYEPYSVSIQKLKLSAAEVRKTDFSEMHMVATLQGKDSPYRMNGLDPYYYYTSDSSVSPVNYQWYKSDEPDYDGTGVNAGGFYPMPQSYYASWLGPVAEEDQPMSEIDDYNGSYDYADYQRYLQEEAITYREEADAEIHVQNAIALPARYTDVDEENGEFIEYPGWEEHIKAGIMNYGALTTGIYWGNISCEDQENYYYSGWDYGDDNNYLEYIPGNGRSQNHEVVVVGWDDDYPKENFRYHISQDIAGLKMPSGFATPSNAKRPSADVEFMKKAGIITRKATPSDAYRDSARNEKVYEQKNDAGSEIDIEELEDVLLPERDGAWIIRNSWGEGSGDKGYYYVSYCDKQLFGGDNTWAYTATETTDNYNKLYEVTSLPWIREYAWISGADSLMASTTFIADEDGADVLKAVSFTLLNNNTQYEISVNLGEDIGKGWIEENVYAAGSKLYAGYYTVRLDKALILEPGEPFEIILKISGDGQERLIIPFITNGSKIADIPKEEDVCRLYDPEPGEWIDIGQGFAEDNGSSNYYGYFTTKAICNDAALDEGETDRITVLEIEPEDYYPLIDDPYIDEDEEDEVSQEEPADEEKENLLNHAATPSNAMRISQGEGEKDNTDAPILKNGHVLQNRTAGEPLGSSELPEPETVLPESFDLRDEGVLTPVKNQAATNTCWSFGSTAAVESSYLINGSNLYDFNYSSGISLETSLPITEDGMVIYSFDKDQPEGLEQALFIPRLLAWDDGPIEDADGSLRWELSGDLSSVDISDFKEETGGTGLTGNGEEVLLFTPEESGILTVSVSSAEDPTKTASCRVLLLEEDPVDEISVSPESLRLKAGETHRLEVTIKAPEGSDPVPVFSSDNPNIASVDENGLVLGVDSGTTMIRVRAGGETAVCRVTVWKPERKRDSGRDTGYPGSSSPVAGSWTLNADGSWSFTAGGRSYSNEWGFIHNPYGSGGQGEAGWFRFDNNGRMLTGWFMDADGKWYYLNPVSDGSLGKMLTGWRWIPDASGREYCYYFHTETGGPMGSMAAGSITPDGYEVDFMGRWCINGIPAVR